MKRSIEINDTLQERVDDAIEEVKELLLQHLKENPDDTSVELNDLDYNGSVHEIVDGSVPVYTSDIKDIWYLYGYMLEEAYENAGVGDNPRENDGMSAIYFYIREKVDEWWNEESAGIISDWVIENIKETEEE